MQRKILHDMREKTEYVQFWITTFYNNWKPVITFYLLL